MPSPASDSNNPVLRLDSVSLGYGDFTVLRDISLEVFRGQVVAMMGGSGSGKTTLLNLIGGLDRADEGSISINGEEITQMSSGDLIDFRLKNIGFVFQSYNLIPVLTAKENVEFIMQLQGINEKDRIERVKLLFKQIGLEDKMDNRPSQLSGGQQQRVAVARALASRPQFVLADEPTANLDSASANNLLDIMWKLNQEEHITFIFSTHDQRVIDRAKRVITLVDGRIVSDTNQVPTIH